MYMYLCTLKGILDSFKVGGPIGIYGFVKSLKMWCMFVCMYACMYVCMYVSSDLVIQIRLYFHRCSCQKKRRASPISPCQRLSEVPTESESILLHKTCKICLPVNSIYVYVTIYML